MFFFQSYVSCGHYLWVSKLKKIGDPYVSSWIFNNFTRVVEVINKLNLLRFYIDKISSILLQSFGFLAPYTKIDPMDLKARKRVLMNKMLHWMLELHHYKFLMAQKIALNFRFLWLKNKVEINLFENLCSFKVVNASNLISWLDFLLDKLFLCFGQGVYR